MYNGVFVCWRFLGVQQARIAGLDIARPDTVGSSADHLMHNILLSAHSTGKRSTNFNLPNSREGKGEMSISVQDGL
jgi:hypothetical protein